MNDTNEQEEQGEFDYLDFMSELEKNPEYIDELESAGEKFRQSIRDYFDLWVMAGGTEQEFINFIKQTSKPKLPKGKRGKRYFYKKEDITKALIDYYEHVQYQGITIAEFTLERFGGVIAESTWHTWRKNYENGNLK